MMRLYLIVILLFLLLSVQAQENRQKYLRGKVYNKVSGLGIENVKISFSEGAYGTVTNRNGKYIIKAPILEDSISFEHPEYQLFTVNAKKSRRVINAALTREMATKDDLPTLKNTLSFLPIKLITGGLGINYQHFIKTRFLAGLYATYYFNGRQYFGNEKFTGFKLRPHARFFFKRNKSYGFYVQAEAIIGHFDFSTIYFKNDHQSTYNAKLDFWTGGIGGAIGIMDVLGNSKNLIVDINFGFQSFPFPIDQYIDEHGVEYSYNPIWWYFGGPGSAFEIKFSIGGIF